VYASKSYVDSAISNANLSNYLTTSAAASTYLSQATAASTYATQSSVSTAISNVINAAPAALDTLKELADALGSDAAFSTTVTTSISGKLAKASNLSDVADVSAARTNLGLGSMATQSAGNVAITGGSIDNVTLDGGTY
jgi:nitrogenase molybdenum-iron protein alpha/beta subunit